MNFISCLTWIKKGVAKSIPDKVHLEKEDLERLIEETKKDIKNIEDGKDDDDDDNIIDTNSTNKENDSGSEDILAKYDLDHYDDEEDTNPLLNIAGLTVYANNNDDPYITIKDKDDESEENEDFNIKPTDNLIVVGRVQEDCSVLEIYVYDEEDDGLYVHHDVILPAFPLAIEWLNYDPNEDVPGNYVAVGDMTPIIRIWDIDVVDALEPSYSLGKKLKKKKSKSKHIGHTDAVLSLSWNKNVKQALASGSADHTVLLWDISTSKPVSKITKHKEKVQSVEWHPCEAQLLLTGSCDNTVKLFDCKSTEDEQQSWKVDGEVEKVIWNHFDPFHFFVSTDQGFVYYFDARNDKPVYTIKAHFEAVTGLSLSSQIRGCLITASTDKTIKIWDINGSHPEFIEEKNFNVGSLHALAVSPDSPFVFGVGGDDKSNNFSVCDIGNIKSVYTRFSNYTDEPVTNAPEEEEEISKMETDATVDMQNLRLNLSESGVKPKKKKFRQFKSIKPT